MTTKDTPSAREATALDANLKKIEALSQRLLSALSRQQKINPSLHGPDAQLYAEAGQAYWQAMMQSPAKLIEQQVAFWGQTVQHFVEAQQALATGKLVAPDDPSPSDKRFANPLWDSHPYFNYIKRQYLINAEALTRALDTAEDMSPTEKRRLKYFGRQIIDMFAPTNFLATNPDALQRAVETDGESLVKGLENLVGDLEANSGQLVVRLADEGAFEIGGNIATAEGEVIYRNRMMELIQYTPTTKTVHQTPIVLFPPWINKFYILDLKPQNSLIRWIVDQGYTLFVVSWINPDESYADAGLEDYIDDGFLKAIDLAKQVTGEEQVNAVGYCIAGTTLNLTLSLMKQRGDTSIKSATFLTTLTDFGDQGEFTPFLQNDFIDGIEAETADTGLLKSFIMARTFSYLRSNDLIYQPAIRSYMMGETPPAFDLLYWNGDGANLPGKMAMQYLRGLCQRNEFTTDGFDLMGHRLHISDVDVPICAVTCETDHIAAWKDCYRGFQMAKSRSKLFILSESGHIAGVVNPPSKKKYGHYLNSDVKGAADAWMEGATFKEGSWWPEWMAWMKKRSGKQVPARVPGGDVLKPIAPAPGSYVRVKANAA